MVILAAGHLWLAHAPERHGYAVAVLPGLLLVALGVALSFTPTTMVIASAAPQSHAGLASGLAGSATQVGAALGTATFTAIGISMGAAASGPSAHTASPPLSPPPQWSHSPLQPSAPPSCAAGADPRHGGPGLRRVRRSAARAAWVGHRSAVALAPGSPDLAVRCAALRFLPARRRRPAAPGGVPRRTTARRCVPR